MLLFLGPLVKKKSWKHLCIPVIFMETSDKQAADIL